MQLKYMVLMKQGFTLNMIASDGIVNIKRNQNKIRR